MAGPWTIVRSLGVGGQAEVFEVQAADGRRGALKRLHPEGAIRSEAVARLMREAALVRSVEHPNLVRLLDAGEDGDGRWLVYELIEGAKSIDLAFEGRAPFDRVRLVRDAARGVAALHAQGAAHRDLSLDNVLVDAEGRVRVIDLGLARGRDDSPLTRTGVVLGTPGWVAPEVGLEGSQETPGAAADVWALGRLLFLALTGQLPFPGSFAQMLEAYQRDGPPHPSAADHPIPAALAAACRRALAFRLEDRFADAGALADAIDASLADAAPPAHAPTPAASPRPGGRFGRWAILRRLGRGGMGEVWLARDDAVGREVALKVLRSGVLERGRARFLREGLAATRVRHPALVDLHEAGEVDGRLFIIMEHVEGDTLVQRLDRHSFAPREAVAMVAGLARGVAALHGAGVLHRDIKPANVMLTPDGRPKLVDLGVARITELERLTVTGHTVGTPLYMAPEQFESADVDARADVYGLGAVLFEALTRVPPFSRSMSLAELRAAKVQAPLSASRFRPELERDLVEICSRALAPEPGARFPSAAALAEALETWLAGGRLAGRSSARRPLALLAIGGAAIALLALSPLRALPDDSEPDLAAWRRELEAKARRSPRLAQLQLEPERVQSLRNLAAPNDDARRLWAWIGLGELSRGERARAEEALARAGERAGEAADLLRGGILLETDPRAALAAIDSAARAGLDLAELHAWRIRALLATGLPDRAAADAGLASSRHAGAAAIESSRAPALEATCLYSLGRRDEAERVAKRVHDPPPCLRWERAIATALAELAVRDVAAAWQAFERERGGMARPFAARDREREVGDRMAHLAASIVSANHAANRGPSAADDARILCALRLRCAILPDESPPARLRDLFLQAIEDYRLLSNQITPGIRELSSLMLQLWPEDARLHERIAWQLILSEAEDDLAKSVEVARRAVELGRPPSRFARVIYARALVLQGSAQAGLEVCEGVLREGGDTSDAEVVMAMAERTVLGPEAALRRLRAVAARQLTAEQTSEVRYETFRTLRQLGGSEALQAALAFRGGPSLMKLDERAAEHVFAILEEAERWPACEELAGRFSLRARPNPRWCLFHAHALARQGRLAEALEALELCTSRVVPRSIEDRLRAGDLDALESYVEGAKANAE